MFKSLRRIKEENQAKWWGAILGIFIFFGSFYMLWSNEGRINFGSLAKDSIPLNSSTNLSASDENQLIALNGDLYSNQSLGDPYFLSAADYIQIEREVEMFAWVEREEKGENEGDESTFYYESQWTTSPTDSIKFYDTSYENPYLSFNSEIFLVSEAFVRNYEFNPDAMNFPTSNPVDLNTHETFNSSPDEAPLSQTSEYIYLGFSSISQPDIGDLRISFRAVPHQKDVTAFGIIDGTELIPFPTDREDFYRILFMDRESAITYLGEEYKSQLWGARIGGMVAMWCGLFLLLNPLTILVSFIPILNNASKWVVLAASLGVAIILSGVTITVSFFAHNPFILILLIALIGFGIYALDKYADSKSSEHVID